VLLSFAERMRNLRLNLRDWRAGCSGEVRLLLVGRNQLKFGWETMERIWEFEDNSLGGSD
jgi:hypothetical protein